MKRVLRFLLRAAVVGSLLIVALLVLVCYPASPGALPRTLPHIAREPLTHPMPTTRLATLPHHTDSQHPFEVDLRGCDLSGLDLTQSAADLEWASFDRATVWPARDKLPPTFDPARIMELGKDPGLGVRSLHARGITGRGIGIAVIDQPLPVHHVEYADRLQLYEEVGLSFVTREMSRQSRASMHGAATASIAVGKTVGVAPEAQLYQIATTLWSFPYYRGHGQAALGYAHYADSIRRILALNKTLPAERKIRVISLSIGWMPNSSGASQIELAINDAKGQGILVTSSNLERTFGYKFHGMDRDPMSDPDDFASYRPGKFWADELKTADPIVWTSFTSERLLVPMDHRTVAGPGGNEDYAHYASGGWSWCAPYIAGVYALACQADPAVTPERFWSAATKTARTTPYGLVLDPVALIDSLAPQR